jgi:CBS domain-containing protein
MSAVLETTAAEVMSRTFVTVAPDDTIGEAAEKMAEQDIGSALVVDFGTLVGILTSRDVVRAIAARAHPSDARAREFMGTPPVTTTPDATAAEAARAMLAGGFHHLPVVEHGRPIGVVGLRSVQGALTHGSGF